MNNKLIFIIAGGLIGLLVIGLIAAFIFGGKNDAKPKDDGPITLTYWRAFDDKDKFDPLIEQYEAENPNVKIEYRKLSFSEYERTLIDAFAGGRGPDIFMVHDTWLPRYFDKIEPLPESKYKTADYEREFYPPARQTIKDKRIYGLPLAIDTLGLFVNDTLETEADVNDRPTTWESLFKKTEGQTTLQRVNRRQGDTFTRSAIALGNNTVSRSADILALMMLQQQTKMTNEANTQATFNLTQDVEGRQQPLGRIALDLYTSFADRRTPNYSWNAKSGKSLEAFSKGKVAYMIGYGYNAPLIEQINPELRYEIEPMIQIGGTTPVNYSSYWAETVSKGSEHSDEAWDFLRFLTSQDQMNDYTDTTRTIPARTDVFAQDGLDVLQEQLPTARSWYKGDAAKADKIFSRMIDQVLKGERSQNAIDRAANDLTDILRKLNQPVP